MRIVFMGATTFSEKLLVHLLEHNVDICMIFYIPEEFHISYNDQPVKNYNFADLKSIARRYGIEHYEVNSLPGKRLTDYMDHISRIKPDVILALGWYYMVPKNVCDLAKLGTWGVHASLLPKYAGGAPLVWAIINGEKESGITLFQLHDGVDDGDIIAQETVPIELEDTIADVYGKAIEKSKYIILDALSRSDEIVFQPQDKSLIQVYPQRSPEDGLINLNGSTMDIYNFIRAQTKPYPGAFSLISGQKIVFFKVRICDKSLSGRLAAQRPGQLKKIDGKGYLCLCDGGLEVVEVSFKGQEGGFPFIANDQCLWGLYLES